jgi:hypothetical protein
MRYLAMQVLTWGTIAGAIASAVLLAALDHPPGSYLAVMPQTVDLGLWNEPPQSGRPRQGTLRSKKPPTGPAASTPQPAPR